MTNEELAEQIMDLVVDKHITWTHGPPPKSAPPPGATLTAYVGNAPKLAMIVTLTTQGRAHQYGGMATITTGTGVVFIHLDKDQAKLCFDIAASAVN